MKKLKVLAVASIVSISALTGCAKSGGNETSPSLAPAVPAAWFAAEPSAAKVVPPSEELTKSIQTAFQAHVEALDSVASSRLQVAATDSPTASDYTPWHLDGMIGAFTIDVGGVFGTLVSNGAAGVKVTWQQKAVANQQVLVKAPVKTALHFNPGMSAKEVSSMLAPAVRMAKKTKSVKNAGALARNLNREGMKFLSLVRVLNSAQNLPGWHIDGFQLGLFFTAAGDVTPVIGVGGSLSIIFDWQVIPGAPQKEAAPLSGTEMKIQQSMLKFVQTVSEVLPEAYADAENMRKSGFDFSVFQVGIGIGVGGDIGIARAQASAVGRIIFKKDEICVSEVAKKHRMPAHARLPVLRPPKNPGDAPELFQVEAAKFKEGISRAVSMGNFFAVNASAMDSERWKTTEIELGFDTAISGDLSFVTVTGIGLIRMGFERIE